MISTLDALRRGDLAGARSLRLSELTEFPQEIFGLADTLEVLDLSGNGLTTLPDDLGRLGRLRALFCSNNPFTRLPPSLGDCGRLSQLGFRGCGLEEVPAEALPPRLRWLTLTDNRIAHLPQALGERPLLQKLMLAGNRLRALPDSLAGAGNLELLRLSANRFDGLPPWLGELPRLAWLAWAGNPFDAMPAAASAPDVSWADLSPGALLGEGASGLVHAGLWHTPAESRPVAIKLFKGAMTSDGLPEREMAACLTAGIHPNLTGALGRVSEHPQGLHGLLMPLLPGHWRVLAGPPSQESCSRDVYEPTLRLSLDAVHQLAGGIARAARHLHGLGLLHGDLYAHNILWDGLEGQAVLSDFGAASFMTGAGRNVWPRLEVRAWGLLLGELLDRCAEPVSDASGLRALERLCTQALPAHRPTLAEVLESHADLL